MQGGHPIAYTGMALPETESPYAQIEKEMLAVVFAVEGFKDYTFGRKTVIHPDDKLLKSILNKPLHHSPKRLQGLIIHLQKYDLEVHYEKGSGMFLALPSHTQGEAHQNNQHDEIPFDFGRETFGSEKCYAPGSV